MEKVQVRKLWNLSFVYHNPRHGKYWREKGYTPYHFQHVEALIAADYPRRIDFGQSATLLFKIPDCYNFICRGDRAENDIYVRYRNIL